jgi:membrane protein YdbS with pleckstrin-like domain
MSGPRRAPIKRLKPTPNVGVDVPRPHEVDYLQDDEVPVLQARRHPLSVVDNLLGMLTLYAIAVAASIIVFWFVLPAPWHEVGAGFLTVATLLLLLGIILVHWRRTTSLYTVTADRVYMAYGRLRFHLLQTTYDKVTDLHLHQSLFGRIWGFGTVRVQTAGTGLDLQGVRDPVAFKNGIEGQREAFLHRLLAEHVPTPRPGADEADASGETLLEVRDAATVWTGRPALASFFGGILSPLLFLLFGAMFLIANTATEAPIGWLAPLFALWGLLMVWSRFLQYRYSRFEVTGRGVVLSRGWLSRRRVEATFAKVTDVSVDQDVIARMFGYGRITINTAGSNQAAVTFNGVGDPDKVKAIIDQARREAQR